MFLVLIALFGRFPIRNEKLMIHGACTVIQDSSGGTDVVNSIFGLSHVVNFNYEIKGTDKSRDLGSNFLNVPSFEFNKDKLLLAVSSGFIHYFKINYKVEMLNDTSCKLVKSFGNEEGYSSVYHNLYTNPIRSISDKLSEMKKPVTLEALLNLGFQVVESNRNQVKIHAYPAITAEISQESTTDCNQLECLLNLPVVQIDKMYRQYLIESDDGIIISASAPEEYMRNKKKFPIKISDMKYGDFL